VAVKEALSVMRGVAVHINERKRRMESVEKIAIWQYQVEGWEDEDLLEKSSQLLHQVQSLILYRFSNIINLPRHFNHDARMRYI